MSTLYVDNITEKSSGHGVVLPTKTHLPGGVIQVQFNTNNTGNTYATNSASLGHTLMSTTITTKIANSKIYIQAQICHGVGGTDANMDSHDVTLGCYSGTTLVGGVSSGRNNRTTGNAPGASTWYQTDVPFSPSRNFTYGNGFDVYYKYFQFLETPNTAAGTTITHRIALFNQATFYHNRCRDTSQGGGLSTLTVMEIAP